MGALIRWALVLGVLFFGVTGTIDWWNPPVVPSSNAISDRSVSRVDLVWVSDSGAGEVSTERVERRDPLPERLEPGTGRYRGGIADPTDVPSGPILTGGGQQMIPGVGQQTQPRVYSVQQGDTLGEIAQRFLGSVGVGTRKLRELNPGIPDNGMIRVGQELLIPAAVSAPSSVESQVPLQSPISPKIHVVEEGDTLSAITRKYLGHENFSEILSANRDILPDPNQLKPGLKLRIPNE